MHGLTWSDEFVATPQRFLWHPSSATAILSDLHLGAEAEMSGRGMMMPDVSSRALQAAWQGLCDRLAAGNANSRLIIAGDLFDSPAPGGAAVALARELLGALPASCAITLVPGNHDPLAEVLRGLFDGIPLAIGPAATVGGYTVIHGHQSADAIGVGEGARDREGGRWVSRGLIVGHQHPAVMIRDRVQSAKMICYANCRVRGVPVIVLPAFSRAPLGSLLTEKHWILDVPWPGEEHIEIAGIIEPAAGPARVLNFGTLAALRLPF